MMHGERHSQDEFEAAQRRITELEADLAHRTDYSARVEELEHDLARANNALDMNTATLDANRVTIDGQRHEIERWQGASAVAGAVEAEMKRIDDSDEIVVSARDLAVATVVKSYEARVLAEQTNKLMDGARRDARHQFTPERIQTIRDGIHTVLDGDGTYTRIAQEVEAEVEDKITTELIEKERARVREELNDPEQRTKAFERKRQELGASGELARQAADVRSERTKEWDTEAEELARQAIVDDVEADRPAYIAARQQTWRESSEGRRFAATARKNAETSWNAASEEEIKAIVGDEELAKLYKERAEALKVQLKRETEYGTYLDAFDKDGLDFNLLKEGTRVRLRFGNTTSSHNYDSGKDVVSLKIERFIDVVYIKENSFIVVEDTLDRSTNIYEQAAALGPNEVVHLGSECLDNGKVTVMPTLIRGLPIAFVRTNTEVPVIVPLPLSDIVINEHSARQGKDFTKTTSSFPDKK